MTILYAERYIICDEEAITIYWDYFPLGTNKKIPYSEIKQITELKLILLPGELRIWGMDLSPY